MWPKATFHADDSTLRLTTKWAAGGGTTQRADPSLCSEAKQRRCHYSRGHLVRVWKNKLERVEEKKCRLLVFLSAAIFRLCSELPAPTCKVCVRVACCHMLSGFSHCVTTAAPLLLHLLNHSEWVTAAELCYMHGLNTVVLLWLDCRMFPVISPKSATKHWSSSDSLLNL